MRYTHVSGFKQAEKVLLRLFEAANRALIKKNEVRSLMFRFFFHFIDAVIRFLFFLLALIIGVCINKLILNFKKIF